MTQLWPHLRFWGLCKPTGSSTDVVHLIKYASQEYFSSFKAIIGCPPLKSWIFFKMLFWELINSLGKIVRCFLKSSENFLSNEHKNKGIWSKNGWDMKGERCSPPKKVKNYWNICLFRQTFSLLQGLYIPLKAFLILGEPQVCLKSPQHLNPLASRTGRYIDHHLFKLQRVVKQIKCIPKTSSFHQQLKVDCGD